MGKPLIAATTLALTLAACSSASDLPPPPNVDAPPADAQVTDSGLAYLVLDEGEGPKPLVVDSVLVDYTGWTTNGKMFDSSVTRGQPSQFPLGGVIEGWTEGLQLMSEGSQYRFWIPEDLAYRGQSGSPKGMLVFDVELYQVIY